MPHFLTGPVAIEGEMPGDVLEVEIVDIRLRSPYGWMMIESELRALREEFPCLRKKLIPLDEQNKIAEFALGIRVPARPFFTNLGVASRRWTCGSGRRRGLPDRDRN